jgi:hypothetical protein
MAESILSEGEQPIEEKSQEQKERIKVQDACLSSKLRQEAQDLRQLVSLLQKYPKREHWDRITIRHDSRTVTELKRIMKDIALPALNVVYHTKR